MPQSLAHILLHIIFSTKNRVPVINDEIAPEVWKYMGGRCQQLDCVPLKIGGHLDHIHLLCSLSRKLAVMDLLEEIKKSSSKWIKTKGEDFAEFYWQRGYAVFSVDPSQADGVIHYIENQKSHHLNMGFQDECRMLYRQYGLVWDERYVWD